ncbi:hypothetical protein V3C99_013866 [Haemonchus contortus]|uniref:Transposase n=1 Tax=Haemonchus contortus TaxID=6289 RepID=A0A7I5EC22_HAECO
MEFEYGQFCDALGNGKKTQVMPVDDT